MNVFDLMAKLTLNSDGYKKGLKDAESDAQSFGSKMGALSEKTAKLSKAAMGGLAAVSGFAVAAVKSYADYEQLVGGVETLFGAGGKSIQEYAKSVGQTVDQASGEYDKLMAAQNLVLENSKNAFKDAGMSANEYMETVTGFSAGLIASLGGDTEKAAKISNMAIIDMADNANKMGSSLESIKTAYAGFAKQNYTMLDNLKLGYGGTKTEMERLLADAQELTGVQYDITNLSDVYEAIHAIQEEMGIAGTTQAEAATTISGSIDMVKASFQNLLSEFAKGDADIETAVGNLVTSVKTAWGNILPVIETLWDNIPLGGKIALAITGVVAVISPIAGLIANIIAVCTSLAGVLPTVAAAFKAAWAVLEANPIILVVTAITALIAYLVHCYKTSEEFRNKVNAAFGHVRDFVQDVAKKIEDAVAFIKDLPDKALKWGRDMIDNFKKGIMDKKDQLMDGVKGIAQSIKDFLGFSEPKMGPLSNFHTYAPDMIDLFVDGMNKGIPKLENAADSLAGAVSDGIEISGVAPMPAQTSGNDTAALVQMFNALATSMRQTEHTTIIELDGMTIAKAVDKPLQDIDRQRGLSLAGGEAW